MWPWSAAAHKPDAAPPTERAAQPELRPAQLVDAIERCVSLTGERRYIEAGGLLDRIQSAIASARTRDVVASRARLEALLKKGGALEHLGTRYRMSEKAFSDLKQEKGWMLYSDRQGQRTQYRRENGIFSVRIDADVDGVRPADTLFIWREASLFCHWMPLISRSAMLHDFHPAEVALHLEIDQALVYADLALHGWGCDHLQQGGFMLICVRPLEQAALPPGVAVPPQTSARRVFPSRRVPASLDIMVEPRGRDFVHFSYSISYPLHDGVPTWAVNIILGQGMAHLFAHMRAEAQKMAAGDAKRSHHLARQQEPSGALAADWLSERLDPYVAALPAARAGVGGAATRPQNTEGA